VITLDVADLVVIAGQTLGIGTDAALGQLDVAAAQAALTEARLTGRAITDQDTAAVAGIRLMHALLRHRPFALHGERVAVAAGLQFLSLNGWRADLDPPATAAVVVEALACGQLSPASAAAWLSPRLAAGRDQRKPPSVIYPQVLLFVQAGCWALGAAGGLITYVAALANGMPCPLGSLPLAWLALAGGLATAKILLGLRLDRGRSKRTWWAVIATELAMTCFGILWLFISAYAFIMLGLSGAGLSLAAVLCMTRPRARQYCADPDAVPGTPYPDALSGSAGFWRLAPASQRLVII
jgi:prophage maintenance system killer protein